MRPSVSTGPQSTTSNRRPARGSGTLAPIEATRDGVRPKWGATVGLPPLPAAVSISLRIRGILANWPDPGPERSERSPTMNPRFFPARSRSGVAGAIACVCVLVAPMGCASEVDLPVTESARGDLDLVLVESGDLRAVRSTEVNAPMEWRSDLQLIELVDEGVVVDSGIVLARIDPAFLEEELLATRDEIATERARLRGILANQHANLARLQNAATTARLSHEIATLNLEKLRFESTTQREEAELSLENAVVALAEAETKIEAQAILDSLEVTQVEVAIRQKELRQSRIETQIENLTLRAPQPGLVIHAERDFNGTLRKPRVGDTVFPGIAIIEIPDLTEIEIELAVSEVDRHQIREGMRIRGHLEAYPDETFTGSIRRIGRLAVPDPLDPAVRQFPVWAVLDRSGARLKPGMTAVVSIELQTVTDAVVVSAGAVFERDGAPVVFPRRGWPDPREVTVRAVSDRFIALEGIDPGEELVVSLPGSRDGVVPLGTAAVRARDEALWRAEEHGTDGTDPDPEPDPEPDEAAGDAAREGARS